MDTVIYHSNCWDGFCAAWLCHGLWPEATYIPAQYGSESPNGEYIVGKNVLILDFSYPRELLENINTYASSLCVLDHHKTAQQNLSGLPYCIFDMSKSGARLTFEYLRNLGYYPPTGSSGAHWLVDYTEDRDLWRHQLPFTHEINNALRSYPLDFTIWDTLAMRTSESLIPEGTAIQRYKNIIIEHHIKYARLTTINGHQAIILETTCTNLSSDIADKLLNDNQNIPIAIITTNHIDGTVYQLRSRTIDVSKIAEAYGGGGHATSAAFKLPDFLKISRPTTNA